MKKTLITLLALSGLAIGETVVFDFGRTDLENYKTPGAIIIGKGNGDYKQAFTASGSLTSINGNYSYTQQGIGSGGYNNSATKEASEEPSWKEHLKATPAGWESTFADGLTSQYDLVSSGNVHTLEFTGLAAGYYDFSILGGYYGNDGLVPSITLTLSGDIDVTETSWSAYDIAGGGSETTQGVLTFTKSLTNGSGNEGYTFDVSKVYVEEGGSLSLVLTGNATGSNRTPLNGVKMSYTVPEPTTAALSLLALAGLAARRRRK